MSLSTMLTITRQNRKACKRIMESLTLEQINHVPAGFNNNIIWNVAHILSVQQMLLYGLSGNAFTIPEDQIIAFNPGSRPEKMYSQAFSDMIKAQLFSTLEQLQTDVDAGKFIAFTPFMTAIKVEVNDLESAVAFNQYHEALHMGYILNIRRFL